MRAAIPLSTLLLATLAAAIPVAAQTEPDLAPPPVEASARVPAGEMAVTLLGTGTPSMSPKRFGYSTLVQANGLNLVFDAGRGNTIRLAQLGVPLGAVTATFLTHFHSDHLNGLPDLWATSFLISPQNRRVTPFELYGPAGTRRVAEGMQMMFSADVDIRRKDNEVRGDATRVDVHEFARPGVVFDRYGVRVTAFEVNHGEAIKPSFGYKVEYNGHSVVLSGDTKYDERVLEAAKDADLLVHEVSIVSSAHVNDAWAKPSIAHHTSPEEAGRLFAQARPKYAVFSHISRPGPQDASNTDAALQRRAQAQWPSGNVLVGTDLMRFVIGRDVTMVPWRDRTAAEPQP